MPTQQAKPTQRTPLLQAVRLFDSSTWHLTWRVSTDPSQALSACGVCVDAAQWANAAQWLALREDGRCSPCEVMAPVLLSQAREWNAAPGDSGLLRRWTDPGATPAGAREARSYAATGLHTADRPSTPDPERPPVPPTSLRIGAFPYSLRVDANAVREWAEETHGHGRFAGFSDRWVGEIAVTDTFPDGRPIPLDKQQETVLHEVLHCVLAAGSWDADVVGHVPPAEREEYTVSALSETLFAVLRAHPELTAYLLAK